LIGFVDGDVSLSPSFNGLYHKSISDWAFRKTGRFTSSAGGVAGVPVPKDGAAVELKNECVDKYLKNASEKK
jgi:hypothetical protein